MTFEFLTIVNHKMKRVLFILLCVLPVLTYAGNTLTLSTSDGSPGETVTLIANLAASDAIVAAEIVIPLGDYISYVPPSAVLASGRSDGHSINASQVGTELRVYIYSLSLQPLKGSEGELFRCSLKLGNKPLTQTLQPQVVLSSESGASVSAEVQSAAVTILAPEMQVQTPAINFGHIPIRSTYTQQLSVKNTGNQPLTISSVTFTDAEFSTAAVPVTIAAGATQSIAINYAPTRHGVVSASLTIYSDAVNGMYNAVRDVALAADPFSVNELHVGNTSGVADDTVSVPLTMNNMEPISAGQVQFILPKALRAVSNGFRLSARATDHVAMTQLRGDTLTLYFYSPTNTPLLLDDGELGTLLLRLDGTSGTYYLRPKNTVLSNTAAVNMVSAVTDGYVRINSPRLNAPTSLNMGTIAIVNKAQASLTVSNSGSAPLIIERTTFLAEDYRCVTTLPLTIQAGRNTPIEVEYTPGKAGAFNTTMQLYTNDPDRRMYSVALSGSVYEPNSLTLSGHRDEQNYVLSVGLDNYSEISALQFEISGLPAADVQLTAAARLAQHSAMLVPMGGGTYRVVVYNMANTAIPDHSGEVLQLSFPTTNPMHIEAAISNVVISNLLGQNAASLLTASWQDEVCTHTVTVQSDNTAMGTITLTIQE